MTLIFEDLRRNGGVIVINTVKDLLDSLKEKGLNEIEEFVCIKHGPTIGAMYEGLTKELMNKAIFEDFDLKVCSGFISNSNELMSKQIDCMIVRGLGRKIPYTGNYIYDIDQVVAVIEVKKNLFAKEVHLAYENLFSIKNIVQPNKDMPIDRLEQSYENVTGRKLPSDDEVKKLPEYEQNLYHALVVESYLPVRIVMGYSGFSTEKAFREGFVNYIFSHQNMKGYGITSMPSLMVAGSNSIIKTNGLPFGISDRNRKCGEWIAMGTSNESPLFFVLYLIWTRLYYLFPDLTEDIFDNTEIEMNPLLKCRCSSKGWEYTVIDAELQDTTERGWEPVEISLMSNALLKMIERGRTIKIDDVDVIDVCSENGECLEDIIEDLKFKRVIWVRDNVIEVLPEQWLTVMYNGKFYFGDNFNNRMIEWYQNLL